MMTLRRLDRFLAGQFDPQNDRAIRARLRTVVTYDLIKRMFEAFFDDDRKVFTADDNAQRIRIHELQWTIAQEGNGPFKINTAYDLRTIHSPSQLEEFLWDIRNAIEDKNPIGSPGQSPRGGIYPSNPGRYYD